MANRVLHQERAAAPMVAAVLAVVAAALIVADVATGWGLLGWGLLAGPFLLIIAAFFWGMARYYTIRLTPARLIVGRGRRGSPSELDCACAASRSSPSDPS